jgi:hypothetical protein
MPFSADKQPIMKRRATAFLFLVVLGGGIFFGGCDIIALDEAEPTGSIPSSQAFTQITGFRSALAQVYDGLQSVGQYGQLFMLYPEALADNSNFIQGANRYNAPTQNQSGAHLTPYGSYGAINLANNIITKIQGFEDFTAPNKQAVRDEIRGQALFLRALNYFDLVRCYAYEPGREVNGFTKGVILRTQPTESPEDADFRSRAPNTEVYQQVVSDLETAIPLLEGTDLGKNRANAAAAYALLARVQVYRENWSAAEQAATNAIDAAQGLGARMMTPSDYPDTWFAETLPGSLFELRMNPNNDGAATNSNESLASLSYAERAADESSDAGFRTFNFQVIPSEDLLQTYPSGDVRRTIVDTLSSGTPVLAKYNQTLGSFADRIPIIRLAEVYFLRAEARAEQGDDAGARSDLNVIRTNRGIGEVGSGVSGQALIDSILVERRRELVYEGHRFFTLKRRTRDIPKPQSNVPFDVLQYEDFRVLAPLPSGEVASNPELEQNPGY